MTTPPPLPERPLIEAWGVRDEHGNATGFMYEDRAEAEGDGLRDYPAGTVVPLIAADRLTASTSLVEAAAHVLAEAEGLQWGTLTDRQHNGFCTTARAVLAALRTHLERP